MPPQRPRALPWRSDGRQSGIQELLCNFKTLIQLLHPGQAVLNRGDHLLLQPGDFLFSIGLLDPGAPQRQPAPAQQNLLHGAQRGFKQQERIFLRTAERRFRSSRVPGVNYVGGRLPNCRQTAGPAAERVAMTIGAESGAATGPIPEEARPKEGLRLERAGAGLGGARHVT
jgi:hypothetical protein